MKRIKCILLCLVGALLLGTGTIQAQALKVNIPFALVGTPNIGYEHTISRQFTVNGDILWAPYLFKKNEEVFRALIGTIDFRYYINPRYYYTNDMFDGFYVGPYGQLGNFNIGLARRSAEEEAEGNYNHRYRGWGMAVGVTGGYKMFLSERFRLDFNIGIAVTHLQWDQFRLGGEHADYPEKRKETSFGIWPTRLGIHLVYNIFR